MMRFIPLIIVGIGIALFAVLLAQPETPVIGRTGQTIEDVTLQARNGAAQPLLNGKPTIVNVFASWCVPCAAEMSLLAALKQDGFDIVGLAYKDKPADLDRFLQKFGNPYSAVLMDNGHGATALSITGVPETFVIDASGKAVWHFPGALLDSHLPEIRKALTE